MRVYRNHLGPYGMGWWGFKFKIYDCTPKIQYEHIAYLTISLGTRMGWDGYQVNRVSRAYEWCLEYKKRPPVEAEEISASEDE